MELYLLNLSLFPQGQFSRLIAELIWHTLFVHKHTVSAQVPKEQALEPGHESVASGINQENVAVEATFAPLNEAPYD